MKQLHTSILEYLKTHNKADILGFGIFFLKDTSAKVLSTNGDILPPAKEIHYEYKESIDNTDFVSFLTKNKNISVEEAQNIIKTETEIWKKHLRERQNFNIENLGKFSFEGENFQFQGERIENLSPDFFGLEKINLTEIQENKTPENTEENPTENYRFGNFILWTFLFIIPILGLLGAGIWYSSIIFGKKSFETISIQKGTNRIQPTAPKIDTINTTKKDSLNTKK